MRVQHNIPALNAYRNYTNNTKAINKNLEKLSSGYRINRAGDDAAGLAISEKMRAQITGLATAQKNAKDGISLIQTAEGALTEVHSMLNRMFELAEQSANGTYDNEVDRANLQKEFDALRSEIDRVADSSNFNGKNLLDGSLTSKMTVTHSKSAAIDLPTAAGNVYGTNTIVHKDGTPAAYSSFSIDIGNLSVNGAVVTDKLTVKIGADTIDLTDVLTAGSHSTEDLIGAIKDKLNGKTATLDTNKIFDVTVDSKGIITFKQQEANAATNGHYTVNKGVTIAVGGAGTGTIPTANGANGNVTYNQKTINNVQGKADTSEVLANTFFTLDAAQLVDGGAITIGDTTYTFAVGSNSNHKDTDNVIDLTSLGDGASDADKLALAGELLSRQDNAMVTIGHDGAGKISLEEKSGQEVADLTTETKFESQVYYSTAKRSGIEGSALQLQIGDTSEAFNILSVDVADMHCAALGIDSSKIKISEQGDAQSAMDAIKNAINSVSSTRGDLGALQNRLDHTINNLSVMEENITDAESSIRDTDVAKEMMAYTKNNILIQASQAMLAQANQLPQGVLQLMG